MDETITAEVPISRELADYMAANPGVVEAYVQAKIQEQFEQAVIEWAEEMFLKGETE